MVLEDDIYVCDITECGATMIVSTEDELRRFEDEWHSSLTLDLCGACRETETGKALIVADKYVLKTITERRNYGVNL